MVILAIFRSRAQALDCVSLLRGAHIAAQAVSTPSEARVGCGVSVRISGDVSRARALLQRRGYSSFSGFMKAGENGFTYL